MNTLLNRRNFLGHTARGLGGIALASLLQQDRLLGGSASPIRPDIDPGRPFAARRSHHAPAAKNVLVIFCSGACSQVDTFDYKPELIRRHGQPMPGAEGLVTFQGEQGMLTKSPWQVQAAWRVGQDDFGIASPAGRTGGRHVFHPLDDREDQYPRAR